MKKHLFILALLCSVVWLYAGCSAAKNAGSAVKHGAKEVGEEVVENTTDASITTAVKAKMADDETVSARNIDVDTDEGYVVLKGTVSSPAEETRAIEIARSVDGVKSVRSELVVISGS
jgi:osmotically-inducible protein OsmY